MVHLDEKIASRSDGSALELGVVDASLTENSAVPSFARAFPRDEALDDLVRAFVSGNYDRVRKEAPELALRATDPTVQEAARTLSERIRPDPLSKIILLAAVMLLAVMAAWWITHDGGVS